MLRELLADGHTDAVIALFAKLVARNGELERKLADMLAPGRKNEGVSSAQLLLLIEGLAGQPTPTPDVAEADAKLGEAAALEPKPDANEVKPKRQPPLRKPLPAHLRRVENPIAVPETERPCPRCGGLRTCIGHDVTEVLDLIPAEVVVRVDRPGLTTAARHARRGLSSSNRRPPPASFRGGGRQPSRRVPSTGRTPSCS